MYERFDGSGGGRQRTLDDRGDNPNDNTCPSGQLLFSQVGCDCPGGCSTAPDPTTTVPPTNTTVPPDTAKDDAFNVVAYSGQWFVLDVKPNDECPIDLASDPLGARACGAPRPLSAAKQGTVVQYAGGGSKFLYRVYRWAHGTDGFAYQNKAYTPTVTLTVLDRRLESWTQELFSALGADANLGN